MTSDFLSLISHGWVVTFQDSHRKVFTFRSWLDLLGVVLAFWISILKISKLLQNCWHRVIDITSFEKQLESSLDHTLNFCRNLMIFPVWLKPALNLAPVYWYVAIHIWELRLISKREQNSQLVLIRLMIFRSKNICQKESLIRSSTVI